MEWKIVGIFAAVCTTIGFIPQIVKGIRTKRLDDVSPSMYILLMFGVSLWISYGIHIGDMIIIVANSAAVSFSAIILILRYKYIRQK
jgi:MtN3 and saliva related transmembrane protein